MDCKKFMHFKRSWIVNKFDARKGLQFLKSSQKMKTNTPKFMKFGKGPQIWENFTELENVFEFKNKSLILKKEKEK